MDFLALSGEGALMQLACVHCRFLQRLLSFCSMKNIFLDTNILKEKKFDRGSLVFLIAFHFIKKSYNISRICKILKITLEISQDISTYPCQSLRTHEYFRVGFYCIQRRCTDAKIDCKMVL